VEKWHSKAITELLLGLAFSFILRDLVFLQRGICIWCIVKKYTLCLKKDPRHFHYNLNMHCSVSILPQTAYYWYLEIVQSKAELFPILAN